MESSSVSSHQEEPLDLSLGNHGNLELSEDQQQILQMMESCGMFLQQNIFAWLLQSMLESTTRASTALEEKAEIDSKENAFNTSIKINSFEENESTPSPAQVKRRTSTGKIDRRMVGKVCTRRVEANARERNRVQQLSKMFDHLRVCLPIEDDTKISKLATLKVASSYIGFLGAILEENPDEEEEFRKKLQLELENAKSLRK